MRSRRSGSRCPCRDADRRRLGRPAATQHAGRARRIDRRDLDGFQSPPGATVIDLSDHTVLPGLIDLHVHLTSQSSPSEYAERMSINPADEAIRGTVYAEPSARRRHRAAAGGLRDEGRSGLRAGGGRPAGRERRLTHASARVASGTPIESSGRRVVLIDLARRARADARRSMGTRRSPTPAARPSFRLAGRAWPEDCRTWTWSPDRNPRSPSGEDLGRG